MRELSTIQKREKLNTVYAVDEADVGGDWRDEFNASYHAAIDAPNLSDEDRARLMIDAYDRAKEAGQNLEYDKIARRLIYGY